MTGSTFPATREGGSDSQGLLYDLFAVVFDWAKRILRKTISLGASTEAPSSYTSAAKPLQKFVVLAHQRTGSNLLCGILYQHPQIYMHNELFNDQRPMTYNPEPLADWNFARRDAIPMNFCRSFGADAEQARPWLA